ncbi:MAG: UDP-N-acetylmuramate dehydrogenase [Firmicutes bacterium]|nr:UDP-N-acetylmuramate dehydrogenase [Bacillota bacterium]
MNNDYLIKTNAKLKNYTTFKIGGKAEMLIECYSVDAIVECVKKYENIKILGGGSNVLVSDDGIEGVVLINRTNNISECEEWSVKSGVEDKINLVSTPNSKTYVFDSGTRLSHVARFFLDKSLSGLEFAEGIPGTMGGAVFMNAGAHCSSMKDVVEFVEVLRNGEIVRLTNEECGFEYRNSFFKSRHNGCERDVILRVAIRGTSSNKMEISLKMTKYREFRRKTQPVGASAGSVFKGGEKPAGYYIDNAGLKGLSIDGAEVSRVHANFILNTGFASAKAVKDLIKTIKARVKEEFGFELEEEIEFI